MSVRFILGWVVLALALAACGPSGPRFHNADITGADYAKDFALTDHTGKPRTLADFRGKVVLVFFGYTRCQDARRVQVLFVTVDPERDTQQILAQYVPAFDPGFLGLYGDAAATARTARDFKVFYQKVPGTKPDSYTMDHTAGSYAFDPQGRLRLFVRHGGSMEPLLADFRTLLSGK